ncbi:MAG: tetratricopeptide repeat protein [Ignavibacteriales bacterium]|nr:tetratricopeptide repeat protein [Ignavibacteriales bacterium]
MSNSLNTLVETAINELNTGNIQSAADLFQEVLLTKPQHAESLLALMMICFTIGDFENAKIFIDRIKTFHPENPAAYNTLGMIHFKNARFAEAVEELHKAIALDEFNPEPYYNISLAYIRLGKTDEAVFYLIRNIAYNPFDYASKDMLMKLYNQVYKQRYTAFPIRNEFATIINFSSLDESFIDACIDNVLDVSTKVVVIGFSKLFDGQDDLKGMQKIIDRNKYKNVEFVIKDLPPKTFESNAVYHNITRIFGFEYVKDSAPYVLFIDGDEVAEKQLLQQWKDTFAGDVITTRFFNYWYFREPVFQAENLEWSPVLFDTNFLKFLLDFNYKDIYRQPFDRNFYEFTNDRVSPAIFHHFSWVRTKLQMLDKVKNWGHKNDRNWTDLVEEEFQHEFTGQDFVHGYSYKTIENIFNIHLTEEL